MYLSVYLSLKYNPEISFHAEEGVLEVTGFIKLVSYFHLVNITNDSVL